MCTPSDKKSTGVEIYNQERAESIKKVDRGQLFLILEKKRRGKMVRERERCGM
jgi:hypothetical protein